MANRYRLYPTEDQAAFMRERHCADARYVWNLAVEQFGYRECRQRGTTGRSAPGPVARQKQLAEARQEFDWLRGGSSSVQQQALRDFDRAVQACFDGNAKEPRWRKRGKSEGFCVRDTTANVLNDKWAQVHVPKLGWVKFKLSCALPAGELGMARITCSLGGRWHVSFPSPQPVVADAGRTSRSIGIDRGVATTIATSDKQMFRAPKMRKREQVKLARLQREKARRGKSSRRRRAVVKRIAVVHETVAGRRRDWVEKLTTRMKASGTALVEVAARYSSQECRKCGHTAKENRKSQAVFLCLACGHGDHADHNAAEIILARARPAPTPGPGATPQGVGTARCARESENQGWAA